MSAAALLSELRRRDIELRAVGGELRCSAPTGALTDELREELRRRKSDLVALLASTQLAAEAKAVIPLQPDGTRTPVFAVPGHNGDVFCYRALARHVGADQPFFGLQPPGLDPQSEPHVRIEELAAYFAEQVQAFDPARRCIIAGFCAGGTVAFELAQQLSGAGVRVRFLALFGSPYPDYFRRRAQLRYRIVAALARCAGHGRNLLYRSWSERGRYVARELRERRARRAELRAAALDPVLEMRARVERATLRAVRAYKPRRFAGELRIYLPGGEWLRSGVGALRWSELAARAQHHYGPESSSGADMLLEPHAAAFAELFRRTCEERQ